MVTDAQRLGALSWLRNTHYRFETSGANTGGLSQQQLRFMNRVLCRIDQYSTNAEAMPAGQRNDARSQLAELLQYEGSTFERGYDNMEQALVGMADSGGVFSDVGNSSYTGGREKCFPDSVEAPDPFVYFATALDERLADARQRLLDFHSSFEDLAAEVATNDTSPDAWQRVRSAFDTLSSLHENVERYHWLLALPYDQIAGQGASREFQDQISSVVDNRYLSATLRAYDIVSVMDDAARMSQQIQAAAGTSSAASTEAVRRFSHFLGFMRIVCHFLPVLGSFYESMFDGIPGLIHGYRTSLDNYRGRIDGVFRAAQGSNRRGLLLPGETQNTASTPPAVRQSRCSHCGCASLSSCSGRGN